MKVVPVFACLTAIGLAGCSSIPTAGPTTSQIVDAAAQQQRFDLVEVDSRVVDVLHASRPVPSFRTQFGEGAEPPSLRIGVGDTVSVSIYDAGTGGFFGTLPMPVSPLGATAATAAPSPSIMIAQQMVAPDGAISVPYAGRVSAAGHTPLEVEQMIEQRLANRLIEPQAIVTITKNVANTVTVLGSVVTGAEIPLSVRGDRLLAVIAAAGGAKSPIYDTSVRLSRGGITKTIPMDVLASDPEENVYARPDDIITLAQAPQTFTVFGATKDNIQIPFDAPAINLAQALAKAGGLTDDRADPAGVFLFRFEKPGVVRALGAPINPAAPSGEVPVVYHLDLRNPVGYFFAGHFPVDNSDMIYVANAPIDQVQKFFTLVGTITGPVIGGVLIGRGNQ